MAGEIIRIGYAIPADIRPGRIFRIRPPVVSLGKIIMFAASASRTERRRNRYWLFAKISIRCGEDTLPVGGCEVGSLAQLLFAKRRSRYEECTGRDARKCAKFSTRYGAHFCLRPHVSSSLTLYRHTALPRGRSRSTPGGIPSNHGCGNLSSSIGPLAGARAASAETSRP